MMPNGCPEGWDDEERTLAERARSDRAAFAQLYRRYVDRVYAYCYRRLGDQTAAEDTTADVFTKALAAIPRYRAEAGSFRAWLFTIAHHAVVDERRRKRPLPLLFAEEEHSPVPGPEQQALTADRAQRLRALLDRLAPDQARVVELRLAELDDKEIARVLGRSPGAVRVAQHRAVKRLRALIDDEGSSDGAF
jgi:RNA polymerase sigma-70 factor (ECF subfamily)